MGVQVLCSSALFSGCLYNIHASTNTGSPQVSYNTPHTPLNNTNQPLAAGPASTKHTMAMRRASTSFVATWMRTQGQTPKSLVEAAVMANETAQGYAGCVVAVQPQKRGMLVTTSVSLSLTGPPKTYLSDMPPYKPVRDSVVCTYAQALLDPGI